MNRQQPPASLSMVNHFWNLENMRPAPNPVLRGNLFGLTPRGSEEHLTDFTVFSDENMTITYDGYALGQADLDVWLRIIQIAGQRFIDSKPKTIAIEIKPSTFLKEIGREGGKSGRLGKNDREWLVRSLKRLCGVITLKTPDDKKGIIGGLIKTAAWNDDQDRLVIEIDNVIGYLFSAQYTLLSTRVRKQLIGDDLSLWLHAFIMAHKGPRSRFFYSVETLMVRCRSRIAEPRKFKYKVSQKMERLMELDPNIRGFHSWLWEKNILHVFYTREGAEAYTPAGKDATQLSLISG